MTKVLLAAAILGAALNMQAKQLNYPKPPVDNTVHDYFGHKVADPYHPLENDTAKATLDWVKAENAVTRAYLDKIPFASKINKRLTELNNYAKRGLPGRENDGLYYWYANNGLQNQSVLYRATTPYGADAEVFIDPNKLSDDGTVALTGVSMSPDGKYTAYTISRSGSDWTEIYVMDTKTRQLLDDHIVWAKFTGADWYGDGFYYSAYAMPEAGKEFSNANEYHRVYYHKLGTPQTDDVIAFEDLTAPLHFHHGWVDDAGKALVISIGGQGNGNALKIKRLDVPGADWVTISDSQKDEISVLDIIGDTLYIYTNVDAPNYRLVTAPLSNPTMEAWTTLVPETENVLDAVTFAGDKLILTYNKDASSHSYVFDRNGKQLGEIKFPTYGSASFSASHKSPEVFYSFTGFTSPASVYSYDLANGESTRLWAPDIAGVNLDDYVTEQIFVTSHDGVTKVPMFITYKKGLKKDGKNPTYMYGYGGFNISLYPGFSANRMVWLENGGIYAQVNMRGGGEYGQKWHEAGTLQQKLNVFDDFEAAAEYMQKEGWTSPEYTVCEGGSNGGLLVGAVVNRRPDLYAVAIPRVGVMDMMRYHLFTIGWNWAHDYGTSADSPEMAEYLLAYSPMHNVQSGKKVKYPAIMVTTADHDDRVVPAHSFKYAAALQAAQTGDAPKIIRIDSKAGHGAGKPVSKVIDEWTDIYSFIYKNLGIEPYK